MTFPTTKLSRMAQAHLLTKAAGVPEGLTYRDALGCWLRHLAATAA